MRPARFALAALLALGLAAPAQAAFPGKRGLVAFDRGKGETSYVYTARPNGSHVKRLPCTARGSDGRCHDSGPVWSASGRRIALTNARGLALMDANGRHVTQVVPPPFAGEELEIDIDGPAISPRGDRLAFGADTELSGTVGRPGDIYLIGTNGRGLDDILSEAFSPAWSSTNRIAFAAGGIFIRRPGTRKVVIVSRDGEADDPDWSPSGRRIAFTCRTGREICDRRATGRGKRRRLVKARRGDKRSRSGPVWSPDARYLAYERLKRSTHDVVVLNVRRHRSITIRNARRPDWQPRR